MGVKMNRIEQENINRNHRSYHVPGCSSAHHPKKNAISTSRHNTIKHELWKAIGVIMLQRYGDLMATDKMKAAVDTIQEEILDIGFTEDPTDYWTEAVPNDAPNRRVDLVNGKNDDRFEFETDHSIRKENAITIHI